MKTFFCWGLLLGALSLNAQTRKSVKAALPPQQLSVSINPMALISADPMIMPGVEWRMGRRTALVGDAGVIVGSSYTGTNGGSRGFALRPAFRYYYSKDGSGYVQAQMQYRMVRYRMHDWLGKDCVNGVPSYEQLQDFTLQKQNAGAAIVTGGIERLGAHWLLDVSVGIGVQHRTLSVVGEDNCCYEPRNEIFGTIRQADIWIPTLPIAIKLAYIIR